MLAPPLLALLALTGLPQDRAQDQEAPGPDPARVEAALEELEQTFKTGDRNAKIQALDRASDVVAPEVIEEIAKTLKDREREIRAAATQALRWMDHPDALAALHKTAKSNRTIQKDEELYPAVLKAIGQHADPSSIRLLAHKPFASPFYQAGRARIMSLGRIRTRASVEALLGMMRSSSTREVERHMGSFRISLMVLTGTDQGPGATQWQRWWSANKKGFTVSRARRELPRPIVAQWTEYWGLEDGYGRTRRREDRGDD